MKQALLPLGLLAAMTAPACMNSDQAELHEQSPGVQASPDDDDDEGEEESEEPIAVDALPAAVRAAALAAVPGLKIEHAEKETEGSEMHYCIHGTAGGEAVEVEVSPDGKVGEIEHGDDEDDGEDEEG